MTFWPFYPRKFGARGDGTTNDLTALDNCYAAAKAARVGGESAAIFFEPGASYGVNGPFAINTDYVHVYGRGAELKAISGYSASSWQGVFHIDMVQGDSSSTIGLQIQDFSIDINKQSSHGISNDYSSSTDTWELKTSVIRNIAATNNVAGKNCFRFRNLENSVKIENPVVNGFTSSDATPTAAMYIEDKGSGANNGNFYILNPFIATGNSAGTTNTAQVSASGKGIHIVANGHRINRCYIRGGQMFNYNSIGGVAGTSDGCTAIYLESDDASAGARASRTFIIADMNMEDWKWGIQAIVDAGGSIRNLKIHHVSIEYKNPSAETGVVCINLNGANISGQIDHNFFMTQMPSTTGINWTAASPVGSVYVDHTEFMSNNAGTWGTNNANKFTGTALDENPIKFHLGNVVQLGGPTVTWTGGSHQANRFVGIQGAAESTTATTEALKQSTAKKYYALRQLIVKPDINALAQILPVSFRINGATASGMTCNVPASGSTSEVVATASSFIEIDPADLINFLLAFNGAESGNVRFNSIRAIVEELHYGTDL